MVFDSNRSDCSTVVFPRMGQGMGQNRRREQGRAELYTLYPVSAVRRFDEKTPLISGFWQNNYLIFCRDSGGSNAGIAPLSQRKGPCRQVMERDVPIPPGPAFEKRFLFLLVLTWRERAITL